MISQDDEQAAVDDRAQVREGNRTGESGDDRQAQIQAAEDELLSLAAQFGNREITRPQWEAARAPVAARLEALRGPRDLRTQIRDDEELLELLAADLRSGEITQREWWIVRDAIMARLEPAYQRLVESQE